MTKGLTMRIAGESGEGIIVAGDILTMASARFGLHVQTYRTYPSEMRGGPSTFQLRVDHEPVLSQGDFVDVLLAFNAHAYTENKRDLREGGLLIYDSDEFSPADSERGVAVGLPLTKIAQKEVAFPQGKNIVALGALAAILSLPREMVAEVVAEKLGKKSEAVAQRNAVALQAGFGHAQENLAEREYFRLGQGADAGEFLVMSGNQAVALGAIAAGCRLFAGYPITPASEIMEYLAANLPKFGGDVVQTEDEMSALAAAIGAAYAGVKAMTATSGPGLSLMTELLDLSSMAEVPVVIVDAQRAGPSTGMSTKTEQSDLNHMLYGAHGEAPRIILAPTDVQECFNLTVRAFNLAETYQMPVIIATDQSLAQRTEAIRRPRMDDVRVVQRVRPELNQEVTYRRYALTASGVSPRSIPGERQSTYVATGLEHDEYGHPSTNPDVRKAMMDKRFRKLEESAKELSGARRFGAQRPAIGIIGWGSTEGAVREAVARANAEGLKAGALYPETLSPLPDEEIRSFVREVKHLIVPEVNYTGQLAGVLRARYGVQPIQVNKYTGAPFTPMEILARIREVAVDGNRNSHQA